MQIENCAICRNHLMEPCIECQPNAMGNIPSEECIPAWGVCNHAFHLHCIRRWLKTRNACPLDSTNWTYQNWVIKIERFFFCKFKVYPRI